MPKKSQKKVTVVRDHPLHVPISSKNPDGVTIRDQHTRRLKGSYLDAEYDDAIAVWTDYFNNKFKADPLLDPDVVKALMASESGFRVDRHRHTRWGSLVIQKESHGDG